MDIELDGKWMDGKWIEWMWKVDVESGAVPDLTHITSQWLKIVSNIVFHF